MCYVVLFLLGVSIMSLLCDVNVKSYHFNEKNVLSNAYKENDMSETFRIIEGTISELLFADLSKTSRVKKMAMDLYLKTSDFPDEELKFRRYPAFESDMQLRVGQRVVITAIKNDKFEYLEIVHIEPLLK